MTAKTPITVCVINLKGGVGKSTITALLSRYAFNEKKKDVLAIDLDPRPILAKAYYIKVIQHGSLKREAR